MKIESHIPPSLIQPLSLRNRERLEALIARVGTGSAFVAMYSPQQCVSVNVFVVEGTVSGWFLAPARDEETAHGISSFLHAQAEAAWTGFQEAARDAVEKARRQH